MEIENIAFSGGGVKGYSYIGVIQYFEEKRVLQNIKKISGTSIGALLGLMVTLGYTSSEMKNIAYNIELSMLEEVDIRLLFNEYGLNSGKKISTLVNFIIISKGYSKTITFKKLYEMTGIHLFISCCDIETYEQKVFDYTRTPDFRVSSACKYSMAVPFVWSMPRTKYIDGCFSKNIPIELLPIEKTIGFYFDKNQNDVSKVSDLRSYIMNVIKCSFNKGNTLEIEKYKLRGYKMLNIETEISASSIDISRKDKDDIIRAGYDTCMSYLKMG